MMSTVREDSFVACLVEETRRQHRTDEVEAIVKIALKILGDYGQEVQNLRYLAGSAAGMVRILWTVSGSDYSEDLEFVVRRIPEYQRDLWLNCESCASKLYTKQAVIAKAFVAFLPVLHAELEGNHLMEVLLVTQNGFEAVLRMTIQSRAGGFVGF